MQCSSLGPAILLDRGLVSFTQGETGETRVMSNVKTRLGMAGRLAGFAVLCRDLQVSAQLLTFARYVPWITRLALAVTVLPMGMDVMSLVSYSKPSYDDICPWEWMSCLWSPTLNPAMTTSALFQSDYTVPL